MGGVGGVHLLTLARLGIGKFNIADLDTFGVENFNRQVGASMSSVDQPKVDVLSRMARDINPELDINIFPQGVNAENLDEFFRDVDLYAVSYTHLDVYKRQVFYIAANVTKAVDIDHLVTQATERFGVIHILYNNAGIFEMAPLLESDEAMFDTLFAVNVKGAFFVMQKVLAHMVANQTRGAVINMTSQAGRRGEALVAHYCATKAAMISYTQSAALAMAPHHIRVNACLLYTSRCV